MAGVRLLYLAVFLAGLAGFWILMGGLEADGSLSATFGAAILLGGAVAALYLWFQFMNASKELVKDAINRRTR